MGASYPILIDATATSHAAVVVVRNGAWVGSLFPGRTPTQVDLAPGVYQLWFEQQPAVAPFEFTVGDDGKVRLADTWGGLLSTGEGEAALLVKGIALTIDLTATAHARFSVRSAYGQWSVAGQPQKLALRLFPGRYNLQIEQAQTACPFDFEVGRDGKLRFDPKWQAILATDAAQTTLLVRGINVTLDLAAIPGGNFYVQTAYLAYSANRLLRTSLIPGIYAPVFDGPGEPARFEVMQDGKIAVLEESRGRYAVGADGRTLLALSPDRKYPITLDASRLAQTRFRVIPSAQLGQATEAVVPYREIWTQAIYELAPAWYTVVTEAGVSQVRFEVTGAGAVRIPDEVSRFATVSGASLTLLGTVIRLMNATDCGLFVRNAEMGKISEEGLPPNATLGLALLSGTYEVGTPGSAVRAPFFLKPEDGGVQIPADFAAVLHSPAPLEIVARGVRIRVDARLVSAAVSLPGAQAGVPAGQEAALKLWPGIYPIAGIGELEVSLGGTIRYPASAAQYAEGQGSDRLQLGRIYVSAEPKLALSGLLAGRYPVRLVVDDGDLRSTPAQSEILVRA